jgi:hypothetical protein
LTYRMPLPRLIDDVPVIRAIVERRTQAVAS